MASFFERLSAMKFVIFLLTFIMITFPVAAQVGRISADGNTDYTLEAQTLKRQRMAAPTYEQLVSPKIDYTGAVNTPQEDAQDVLAAEENNSAKKENNLQNSGRLLSFGPQKEARNLMIVEAVAHYKLNDEKLAEQFDSLENNAEYHRKLNQIMQNLSNNRLRNNKNKEAIRILNDAGNRLYNLLTD